MLKSNLKFSSLELQAEEWLKKAHDDELNARSILKHRDGAPSGVCFLSHQMAEKYLKAFLIFQNKWYPRIHQLDKLLELESQFDPSFIKLLDDALFLNSFYVPTRYPGDYPNFSWQDANNAFRAAEKIKKFIAKKIK